MMAITTNNSMRVKPHLRVFTGTHSSRNLRCNGAIDIISGLAKHVLYCPCQRATFHSSSVLSPKTVCADSHLTCPSTKATFAPLLCHLPIKGPRQDGS